MKTQKPVFISYARRTSRSFAEALQQRLGERLCFLDTEDIEPLDHFPRRLSEGLLGCRLVVVLFDHEYFQRWYCLREWMLALAPWQSVLERGGRPGEEALAHLLIVLPTGSLSMEDSARIPPPSQQRNWPSASQPEVIADIVKERLTKVRRTLQDRLQLSGKTSIAHELFSAESALPFPPQRLSIPHAPENLPHSLHDSFVGRANDLWRLHDVLSTRRAGGAEAMPLSCALQGVGGAGKTRLAAEYVYRFGPAAYPGGVFWVDASDALTLRSQFRSILRVLGVEADGESGQDALAQHLGDALRQQSTIGRVLYVVDDIPDAGSGQAPASLRHYCPALGHVSCLVTSRTLQGYARVAVPLEVGVLDWPASRLLLTRGVDAEVLEDKQWDVILEWCGRLPLALEVLNGVLVQGAETPDGLLGKARVLEVSNALQRHADGLRRNVPEDLVRGPRNAFQLSYERLDPLSRRLVTYLAWFAPASIPNSFLNVSKDSQYRLDMALGNLTSRSLLRRVGKRRDALEMHPVIASFLRTRHSTEEAADEVFAGIAKRFSIAADVEHDAEWRQHLSALVPHFRWHVRRLQSGEPERRIREGTLEAAEQALDALHGLANSTDDDAPSLAIVEAGDLLLSRWSGAPRSTLAWIRLGWAKAKSSLAQWSGDIGGLREAQAAVFDALQAIGKDERPLDWAQAQGNLGTILTSLGELEADDEEGIRLLEEAATALRAALEVFTRDTSRVAWARTHNNLGNVLLRLAQLQGGVRRRAKLAREAVSAHRHALEAYNKEEEHSWAVTNSNLGSALYVLGECSKGVNALKEAEDKLRAALEIDTREKMPMRWAISQQVLALVIFLLGERQGKTDLIECAVRTCEEALGVLTKERHSFLWERINANLDRMRAALATRDPSATRSSK